MTRHRHTVAVEMSRALRTVDDVYFSHDDPFIDFSSAGLYLVGLQTTVATVACSAASIASCWLLPNTMISAVRTLAITSFVGFACMRQAVRVGRARGVSTLFNALRPCVVVYISVLTIEQLVHTCVAVDQRPHAHTLTFISHFAVAVMAASGMWRAARPLSESDGPFIATASAIVVLALLPPPATPLAGPLCQASSLFGAGERLVRAFFFSALFVVHTYASPPQRNSMHDLSVCIFRCTAASVWVLGCHIYILWLPIPQAAVALWARFGSDSATNEIPSNYNAVDTRSDGGITDVELGAIASMQLPRDENGVLIPPYLRTDPAFGSAPDTRTASPQQNAHPASPASEGLVMDVRHLTCAMPTTGVSSAGAMTKARMAEIAAGL